MAPEPSAKVRNTADGEEAHQGARRRHENSASPPFDISEIEFGVGGADTGFEQAQFAAHEPAEHVAALIRKALEFIPPQRLVSD